MNQRTRQIIGGISLILFLALLWYVRSLVVYFIISAILALIGRPLMNHLNNVRIRDRHLPSWARALLVLATFILFIVGLFSLLTPLIAQGVEIISNIEIKKIWEGIEPLRNDVVAFLERYNLESDTLNDRRILEAPLSELLQVTDVSSVMGGVLGTFSGLIVAMFSISFITFFLLKDEYILTQIAFSLTPEKHMEPMKRVLSNSQRLLSRYCIGLLIQISIITLLLTIGLSIIGVKYALTIGFFAGIFNLIPYIGPIIGGTFALSMSLLLNIELGFADHSGVLALQVMVTFIIVQLFDNIVSQPVIFSNSVLAHPLEIFLVISVAGTIGGVVGMIVAIPLYTLIRIVAKEFLTGFKVVQNLTTKL
ncbi:MAG: AI-2E family transporter [Flavobacteriales bacterium]|nr:AI-2E family transporter [Flavobacteriales bacterium]